MKEGLRIGKPLEGKGEDDLTVLYNNLGNTYYGLKRYDEAIVYFRYNYVNDLAGQSTLRQADLWLDVLNMADSYSEKGTYDSAAKYADLALRFARQLDSKSKQSDTYQVLAKLAQHRGDYKKAWEYQGKWYELDTALVNSETYRSIAELEQKYEARERENEKLVLQSEIVQQKFHNRIMMVMAVSLLLIAIAAAMAFIVKRKTNKQLQSTNDLIVRQNERLSELNYEKNSLISIVSHDLSTPFASISMWQQLLENEKDNLTLTQRKALDPGSPRPPVMGRNSSGTSLLTWKRLRPTNISCGWRTSISASSSNPTWIILFLSPPVKISGCTWIAPTRVTLFS